MLHIKDVARTQGFVTTLLGRRRFIPELKERNPNLRAAGERMAINMPIQGTAADIIKLAMIRMADRLRREGFRARMLLQVHDELLFEVPRDEVARLAPVVRETMESAMPLDVPLDRRPEVRRRLGVDDAAAGRARPESDAAAPRARCAPGDHALGTFGRGSRYPLNMPELPEVETIARDLRPLVTGRTITGAWTDWPRVVAHPDLDGVRGGRARAARRPASSGAPSGSCSTSTAERSWRSK